MPDYNDGNWHGWNGGECPVHPKSMVEFVNTHAVTDKRKAELITFDDPLLFRVVKEHREPREWWIVDTKSGPWAFNTAREAKAAYPGCTPIHVKEVTE